MPSVPQAWKDASIVTICKNGDRIDWGTIEDFLFFHSRQDLGQDHTPEVVPETQCGFRGKRSTVDRIFCLRQLQEKCVE